ncbi:MAG: lipoyl synthase [Actinomycetota bacterium]
MQSLSHSAPRSDGRARSLRWTSRGSLVSKRSLPLLPTVQGPARNLVMPEVAEGRKPPWLKVTAKMGSNYTDLRKIVSSEGLHTVCEEARCPNIFECWEEREATFLIGGAFCTRRCAFCDISTGKPEGYDRDEPRRVAESVQRMGLRYAVITGVARDDLDDGSAWLYAECIREIRSLVKDCGVEVLVPDFRGSIEAIRTVCDAAPEVFAHNVETVPRLFDRIRPAFTYEGSLEVLRVARSLLPDSSVVKSNIIVGMGEAHDDVIATMRDLRETGCDLLTIGQYLRPTELQIPVARYVDPQEFSEYAVAGSEMGFAWVEAGPLVRSSYHAGRQHRAAKLRRLART